MRWLLVGLVAWTPMVWAHPGDVDSCLGHVVTEAVTYPDNPDGQPSYPSEPGEYHIHFTHAQLIEAKASLDRYRQTHPLETPQGRDYGSFTVGGQTYDVLEKTRESDAVIVHCASDPDRTHTGIIRARQ